MLDMYRGAISDRGDDTSICIDGIVATIAGVVALWDPINIIDGRMYTKIFQSMRDSVMVYKNVGGRDNLIYHSTMYKQRGKYTRALGYIFSESGSNSDEYNLMR